MSYIISKKNLVIRFCTAIAPLSVLILLYTRCRSSDFLSKNYNLIIFVTATIPALLVMTRVPEGDLNRYIEWNSYAKSLNLIEFLTLMEFREFGYLILTYAISKSPFYSPTFYLFIVVFISYYLILYASYIVCVHAKVNYKFVLIFFIAIISFGPMLALSSQLVRQFIASAIVMLFFALSLTRQKYPWWLLIISATFHYSAIFFLPLTLMVQFKNKFMLLPMLILVIVMLKQLLSLLIQLPFVGILIFKRLDLSNVGNSLDNLDTIAMVFMFVCLAMAIIVSFRIQDAKLKQYCYVFIMLLTFINIIEFIGGTEISVRYFFYTYFLSIILIPFSIKRVKNGGYIYYVILGLSCTSFVSSMIFGVWEYHRMYDAVLSPLLTLL